MLNVTAKDDNQKSQDSCLHVTGDNDVCDEDMKRSLSLKMIEQWSLIQVKIIT